MSASLIAPLAMALMALAAVSVTVSAGASLAQRAPRAARMLAWLILGWLLLGVIAGVLRGWEWYRDLPRFLVAAATTGIFLGLAIHWVGILRRLRSRLAGASKPTISAHSGSD